MSEAKTHPLWRWTAEEILRHHQETGERLYLHDQIAAWLELPGPRDPRYGPAVAQIRRHLLDRYRQVLVNVRKTGYRLAAPNEAIDHACASYDVKIESLLLTQTKTLGSVDNHQLDEPHRQQQDRMLHRNAFFLVGLRQKRLPVTSKRPDLPGLLRDEKE